MSGLNTGTTEAVMTDTFVTPSENEIWVVMERGMEDDQDQFSASQKHLRSQAARVRHASPTAVKHQSSADAKLLRILEVKGLQALLI